MHSKLQAISRPTIKAVPWAWPEERQTTHPSPHAREFFIARRFYDNFALLLFCQQVLAQPLSPPSPPPLIAAHFLFHLLLLLFPVLFFSPFSSVAIYPCGHFLWLYLAARFVFIFFILRFYCHFAFSFSLSLLWSTLRGSRSGGDSAECRTERSVRCLLSSCPIELRVQCKYFNYSCCYSMGSLH